MLELQHLFVSPPANNLLYEGFYDPVLVGFSVIVAVFAAYASLLVSHHVALTTDRTVRRMWVLVGGLCLGFGIWAMHFVGMLAFNLPCSTSYDARLTLLSTIPGVMASILAVNNISRPRLSGWQLTTSGLLIGAGVGTMHYSGMAAMKINGLILYDAKLFLLSILVAVVLATFALWLKFRLQNPSGQNSFGATAVSAGVLGLAVSGMHYTAMLAAYFTRDDNSIVTTGIEPAFLAMIVLTISGLIIVVTIVATYIERPSLMSLKRSYKVTGVFIAGWVLVAWVGVDNHYSRLASDVYQLESKLAKQQVEHIVNDIEQGLRVIRGIPQVVAHDALTLTSLRQFGPNTAPSTLLPAQRRQRWETHPQLVRSNQSLAVAATHLGADAIWIVNAAGDCIAASNSGQADSFIGSNFGDRTYFRQAQARQSGRQYAVGRVSNEPGLYYSAPVLDDGRFIGVVVAKSNVSNFVNWASQFKAFLTDSNGVIILAGEKKWELLAMPDARVNQLPTESLLLQYKKSSFATLPVVAWTDNPRFPAAMRVGNSPIPTLLSSKVLADGMLSAHVAQPLGQLHHFSSERLWLFFLLATSGALLIISVSAVAIHLRQSQKMDSENRIAATAFETQQGMLITDVHGVILRVNRAFTNITGYTAQDAVGQTPRLLQSGRHDAAFYQAMWGNIHDTGAWEGEVWSKRKNAEVYPQWLMITAVKDGSGGVTHYVGTFADITSRKQAEIEINNLAFYDPLTGLPNRRLLLDRLKRALAASTRSAKYAALLFIDLDNFKDLNDSRGHQMGDLLLQQVAQRLASCVRQEDTTARLGGDEFVVMLEGMSANMQDAYDHTGLVGEKILTVLNQTYQLGNYAHHSTPSIGITLFCEHQGTIDDLLKRADMAMYQAKAAGRNTLRFFDPAMQVLVTARAALEDDLREAILKNQFLLYFQAQVVRVGHVTGAEVLLRWQHPQRGLVSPTEFIPLAEESGLILPLGRWVLNAACAQLACWADQATMAHLTLAINVSARQFRHPDFVNEVSAILAHTGANPQRLKLELTESLLVNDVEDIIVKMTTLKAQGVGFSLDDFGTGYSSLSYLKRLPLDQLKIDQGFVKNILTDSNDAAIAKMVIALAKSLGLDVIAEGVELLAQADFLASLGCHGYQGYLFSRPLPLVPFETFVKHPAAQINTCLA